MKFRYRRYRTGLAPALTGGTVARPEIPLRIIGPSGTIKVDALADTGADMTLFPRSFAARIGVPVDESIRWPMGGIAGQVVEASPGEVDLEVADEATSHRWRATVAFVDYPPGAHESVILGHSGFLNHFRVIFDGPGRELEIRTTSTLDGPTIEDA